MYKDYWVYLKLMVMKFLSTVMHVRILGWGTGYHRGACFIERYKVGAKYSGIIEHTWTQYLWTLFIA